MLSKCSSTEHSFGPAPASLQCAAEYLCLAAHCMITRLKEGGMPALPGTYAAERTGCP